MGRETPERPIDYATARPSYRVQRPSGAGCAGVLFAAFFASMAGAPWVMMLRTVIPPAIDAAVLFLATWSTLLLLAAVGILFWAFRRIEMYGAPGRVRQRSRWLFLEFGVDFEFDRAYLARVWHPPKAGGVHDVFLVRSAAGKRRLADANTCADLPALLRWVAEVTSVKAIDARHREPLCTPRRSKQRRARA